MKLTEAKADTFYTIVSNGAEGKARARLDSLGLIAGGKIYVIQASYAGLIVNIKGSRLAISHEAARTLEVEERKNKKRENAPKSALKQG